MKHLVSCKERKAELEDLKNEASYYELVLYGKYDKDYWLVIQINENATLDFKSFSELFNSYQKMNLKICFSGDSNTYGYALSDVQNSWANLIKNILNTKDWYYFTPVLYMSEKCKRELNAEIKGTYGVYVGELNLNNASAEFIFTTDSNEVIVSAEM